MTQGAMKHVVVKGDLEEDLIRPPVLFSELRKLSIEDARSYFSEDSLEAVDCPACGGSTADEAFHKHGFRFSRCRECESVYANPRPTEQTLASYYETSRASRFRTERFAAETAEARRTEIVSNNVNWLGRVYDEAGNKTAPHYADVGTTNLAVFDEIRRLALFEDYHAIAPSPSLLGRCAEAGIPVADGSLKNLGVVTAFEVLEHQRNPHQLLASLARQLAPGGLLFFTTRTISGFDLQTLWGDAPYIYVPEHLNLMSIAGVRRLLDRAGFEPVELSTPGRLDVDLVLSAIRENPAIRPDGFVGTLLRDCDHRTHQDFQAFLQKHRLSSHLRVAAVKKESSA